MTDPGLPKGEPEIRTINVIGAGRIGRDVASFVNASPGLRLGRVLRRNGGPDTTDPQAFLATPADIIVEAAGPAAFRALGPEALARADLWTVSASALVNEEFRSQLDRVADQSRHQLRLFSPWLSGIGQGPYDPSGQLEIRMMRPGIDESYSGPLRLAALFFPDDVNSAVAAALCGPGLERTSIDIDDAGPHDAHRIEAELWCGVGHFKSSVEFHPDDPDIHPTAAAIIGALRSEMSNFRYG